MVDGQACLSGINIKAKFLNVIFHRNGMISALPS